MNKLDKSVNSGAEDEEKHRSRELAHAYEELQRRDVAYRSEPAVASRVQAMFIPGEKGFPNREELAFAGFYEAMTDIGGDLYDVICSISWVKESAK